MTDRRSPENKENPYFKRLQLYVYLAPVVGFVPALWTLYQKKGDRQIQLTCRLAVVLALSWAIAISLLNTSANASESLHLPLLITSSTLTSGYFFLNIWLMIRLWRHQNICIPGISELGDRLP
ncbi:MAG: hypothetical protein J7545_21875 [Roseofilum sp. SBFL]|uniref:hypothetical protein n=1 Tax=unclassified Roseofilum TaxID=2620099 RepID=UPI001B1EABEA|nr:MULTISPECIES: hypothetical protein [unclassified Roseofilum]MBP0015225.1 hypothetical protein [Roseofilum sp. SID3]MBP0024501.1 hypothetical protein [Roseofilum sp. SID2]MBP0038778.1 hypothetical protein [Roseofilum sp. SID1]MBP0044587.1 hypothetical protein [Roseofilum sp. SBFL]